MDNGGKKVVMAQMRPRERREWTKEKPHKRRLKWDKRLLRRSVPLAGRFFLPWNRCGCNSFVWRRCTVCHESCNSGI